MAVSSLSLGASISIFSSQVLFDEKVIDQVSSLFKCFVFFNPFYLDIFLANSMVLVLCKCRIAFVVRVELLT